ncbi:MAG: hypothetical protein J5I98_31250 [Phaeodactylibacter sp.]|nr:hypothetical protein [Phaeodactylibacter sp.]
MKSSCLILLFLVFLANEVVAQEGNTQNAGMESSLPYYEIPPYPEAYTAGAVAARLADGLGFRYYWATEGLRPEDLRFRPNETARTAEETLAHIHGLSGIILNAARRAANASSGEKEELSFEQMRRQTLENIKEAADIFRASGDGDLAGYEVVFQRGENTSAYPFWNLINGPIADAIWHVGQVVSFRRCSGNPLNPKVSLFSGKLRE